MYWLDCVCRNSQRRLRESQRLCDDLARIRNLAHRLSGLVACEKEQAVSRKSARGQANMSTRLFQEASLKRTFRILAIDR